MAQRKLTKRVEETRDGGEPEVIARFVLSFDAVSFMDMLKRWGSEYSTYTLYDGRYEVETIRGGEGR